MRALTIGILTVVGFAVIATALADDVRIGVGGFAVEHRDYDRDHFRDRHVRRDVTVGFGHRDCRTTIIHRDGMTKKIRRCD